LDKKEEEEELVLEFDRKEEEEIITDKKLTVSTLDRMDEDECGEIFFTRNKKATLQMNGLRTVLPVERDPSVKYGLLNALR